MNGWDTTTTWQGWISIICAEVGIQNLLCYIHKWKCEMRPSHFRNASTLSVPIVEWNARDSIVSTTLLDYFGLEFWQIKFRYNLPSDSWATFYSAAIIGKKTMLLLLNHHIWWVSAHSILNKVIFEQQSNETILEYLLSHSWSFKEWKATKMLSIFTCSLER